MRLGLRVGVHKTLTQLRFGNTRRSVCRTRFNVSYTNGSPHPYSSMLTNRRYAIYNTFRLPRRYLQTQ